METRCEISLGNVLREGAENRRLSVGTTGGGHLWGHDSWVIPPGPTHGLSPLMAPWASLCSQEWGERPSSCLSSSSPFLHPHTGRVLCQQHSGTFPVHFRLGGQGSDDGVPGRPALSPPRVGKLYISEAHSCWLIFPGAELLVGSGSSLVSTPLSVCAQGGSQTCCGCREARLCRHIPSPQEAPCCGFLVKPLVDPPTAMRFLICTRKETGSQRR